MTTLYRVPGPPDEVVERFTRSDGTVVETKANGERTETRTVFVPGGTATEVTRYWIGYRAEKTRDGWQNMLVEWKQVTTVVQQPYSVSVKTYYRSLDTLSGNPGPWIEVPPPPPNTGAGSSAGGGGDSTVPKPPGEGGGGSSGGRCKPGQVWVPPTGIPTDPYFGTGGCV
jgi:hypothetical protein